MCVCVCVCVCVMHSDDCSVVTIWGVARGSLGANYPHKKLG